MIYLFTGIGKGKTTAALGQALRAVGYGFGVVMFQFIKSKNWPSGEDLAVQKYLKSQFKIIKGGKGFVGILGDKLPKSVHKKTAQKTLERAKKSINSKKYKIVILDEIIEAFELNLLSLKDIISVIKLAKKKNVHLILTGHVYGKKKEKFKKKVYPFCDLITEFKKIKHPFDKGILAQKGLDY